MPVQKGTSTLAKKLGDRLKNAHAKSKDKKYVAPKGGGLPAGIDNGIAQLVQCKFGEYETGPNKGESFFTASGIVLVPTHFQGIKVEGLRTFISEPLHDTVSRDGKYKKSFEQHWDKVENWLKGLAGEEAVKGTSHDGFDLLCADLAKEKPCFTFRTWKSEPTKEFPNPKLMHTWGKFCDHPGTSNGQSVVDETGTTDELAVEDEPETEPVDDSGSEEDLDALAEAADRNDADDSECTDAQDKLGEIAKQHDIDPTSEEYQDKSWTDIAELVKEARSNTVESNGHEWVPTAKEVALYKPKGAKKAVEVEIRMVSKSKKEADVKNLTDNKIVKGVKWADLSEVK